MHNAVAHHPMNDSQAIPEQWLLPPQPTPPAYTLGMTPYGMEYPFGQLGTAVPAVSPPSFPGTWPHEKLKSP